AMVAYVLQAEQCLPAPLLPFCFTFSKSLCLLLLLPCFSLNYKKQKGRPNGLFLYLNCLWKKMRIDYISIIQIHPFTLMMYHLQILRMNLSFRTYHLQPNPVKWLLSLAQVVVAKRPYSDCWSAFTSHAVAKFESVIHPLKNYQYNPGEVKSAMFPKKVR